MTRCPYCKDSEPKRTVPYQDVKFYFCDECGTLFKDLSESVHLSAVQTVYSAQAWGKDFEVAVKAHGPRLSSHLESLNSIEPFKPYERHLDIGAGVGVLEFAIAEKFSKLNLDLSALEPVSDIAHFLSGQFPDVTVINTDLESYCNDPERLKFNAVFCFGVDYLFRDLDSAFSNLKSIVEDRGRVMFSRNVYMDMPCFFGGKPIRTFGDLVGPNPLISVLIYQDQYEELLARHFHVRAKMQLKEEFLNENSVACRHTLFDCLVDHARQYQSTPVKNPTRALERLSELGVSAR